jgi:hypothetical protein
MKQMKLFIFLLVFILANTVYAQQRKSIDVGKLQAKVFDDGIQSGTNLPMSHCFYPRGSYCIHWDYLSTTTYWPGGILRQAGTMVGNRNWTDTLGNFWPYHVTGHCVRVSAVPNYRQFNIPEEGFTIRRYFRFPPPQIIVDGQHMELPYPLYGDEVAPEKVWGTADVMVECHYRLSNGMDVYQRNLAWSQPDHDDYVVWDLTFVNTGNTNKDEEIELPGQTLDSVIITKHYESLPNGGMYPWGTWAGTTVDQNTRLSYPQDDDSLRINYTSLSRKDGHDYDCYGHKCSVDWGGDPDFLDGTRWAGHVTLFAPKNTSVPQGYPIANVAASNDPAQPSMHSEMHRFYSVLYSMEGNLEDTLDHREPYRCMRKGIRGYDDTTGVAGVERDRVYSMDSLYNVYETTATGAKTYYDQPQDRLGETRFQDAYFYPRQAPYNGFCTNPKFTIGPYNMEFGDTIRFAYAVVAGAISRKTCHLLSDMWVNGDARNFGWVAGMDSAEIMTEYQARDVLAEIYSKLGAGRTLLYRGGGLNNIAKDYIVSTGKDTLFENGMNAQRNFNKNYNIPASPAPPSVFEVNSKPDMIELIWSYEPAYEPTDLAGFKIYRARGGTLFDLADDGTITGDWQMVDSVGPDERRFEDTLGITTGFDYYYYITAVSNAGIQSGKFLTMTLEPFAARLTSYPGKNLDEVRVVPNPFNLRDNQWGSSAEEYKIIFRNLPPECTIRIFTESGELVRTIEHTDGSGTAFWETQWYLTTVNNQRPASGLYIAHIQKPDGESVTRKFIIIR